MEHDRLLFKNRALRNVHAGKRCFILATGPSLNAQDLTPLKGEITIAVNSFFQHPLFTELAPAYYVIADPDFWRKPEISLFPTLQAINEAAPTKFFAPVSGIEVLRTINFGLMADPHFYQYGTEPSPILDIDLSQPVPPFGQNVVTVAIMLALHLGCAEIFLLGCDHTWWGWSRADYDAQKHRHFYPEPSHARTIQQDLGFDELQATIVRQTYEYQQVLDYARSKGHSIYNATAGGCLESFPRITYESLFPGVSALPDVLQPHALGQAAIRLVNEADFSAALTLLDQAMAANIGRFTGVSGLGYVKAFCLAKMGYYLEAVEALQRDLANHPDDSSQAHTLLELLLERETQESQMALQRALSAPLSGESIVAINRLNNPYQASVVSGLLEQGEYLFIQGDFKAAYDRFHHALAIEPHHAAVLNNLGVLCWQMGHAKQAIQYLEMALEVDPQNKEALLNSVEIYQSLGQAEPALTLCQRYVSARPDPEISTLIARMTTTPIHRSQ